jgi:hypothetical protein
MSLLLGAATLCGCTARGQTPDFELDPPTDFSLNFLVRGSSGAVDPVERTSRYLVEANGNLRAVHGRAAPGLTYPPLVRRLNPADMEKLMKFVHGHKLMAEPSSPGAESTEAARTVFELEIMSWNQAHRYLTTPEESPPTLQLLTRLIRLLNPATPPDATEPEPSS